MVSPFLDSKDPLQFKYVSFLEPHVTLLQVRHDSSGDSSSIPSSYDCDRSKRHPLLTDDAADLPTLQDMRVRLDDQPQHNRGRRGGLIQNTLNIIGELELKARTPDLADMP